MSSASKYLSLGQSVKDLPVSRYMGIARSGRHRTIESTESSSDNSSSLMSIHRILGVISWLAVEKFRKAISAEYQVTATLPDL